MAEHFGPWFVDKQSVPMEIPEGYIVVRDANGDTVCAVGHPKGKELTESNANLISMAPELSGFVETLLEENRRMKRAFEAEIKREPCDSGCAGGGFNGCAGCDRRAKMALEAFTYKPPELYGEERNLLQRELEVARRNLTDREALQRDLQAEYRKLGSAFGIVKDFVERVATSGDGWAVAAQRELEAAQRALNPLMTATPGLSPDNRWTVRVGSSPGFRMAEPIVRVPLVDVEPVHPPEGIVIDDPGATAQLRPGARGEVEYRTLMDTDYVRPERWEAGIATRHEITADGQVRAVPQAPPTSAPGEAERARAAMERQFFEFVQGRGTTPFLVDGPNSIGDRVTNLPPADAAAPPPAPTLEMFEADLRASEDRLRRLFLGQSTDVASALLGRPRPPARPARAARARPQPPPPGT